MIRFFLRHRAAKRLKNRIARVRTFYKLQRDVLPQEDQDALLRAIDTARQAIKSRTVALMESAGEQLGETYGRICPARPDESLKGLFDTLVVALSVAACIRALFYQPFKIPTGSMQPTLYGIQSVDIESPEWFDRQPMRFCRWLAMGDAWHSVEAKATGPIILNTRGSARPGYVELFIGGKAHYIPSDAFERKALRCRVGVDGKPRAVVGDVLWSGRIISGDFLFVNRWIWNFRHPRRGEVMVFSTNGIEGLQQGTHYIKRMCGLPGEKLTIKTPNLIVDGHTIQSPEIIAEIANKQVCREGAPNYTGFNPAQSETPYRQTIANDGGSVELHRDQYYALGDNSFNSYDSRYWGPVPERNLLGPASFVHWPFLSPRWGRIR
ncbi:MAG: signal peptidase I [Kiritimatiellia bacterium]